MTFAVSTPDEQSATAIRSRLREQTEILFRDSTIENVTECDGSTPEIVEHIVSFPTAAVLIAALKYLSPVLVEMIKSTRITITCGDTSIEAISQSRIDAAVNAASKLLLSPRHSQSPEQEE